MPRSLSLAFLAAVVAVSCTVATAQESHWLDVPFVAQPANGCGAAVISMTLQYWRAHGTALSPNAFDVAAIQHELYSPSDRGIKATDMARYFTKLGFRTFAFRGDDNDLANHIAKGRPLIIALRESKDDLHYVVVVGTDPRDNAVLVNDPARRKLLKMDLDELHKAWAGASNWTLLVVPNA
jgi:ABC-type bacteriocin/lantibiotic exporter with double-glycine peptidase domain